MNSNTIRQNLSLTLDIAINEAARTQGLLKIYPGHKQLKKDMRAQNLVISHLRSAIELLPSETKPMPGIKEVLARFGATLTEAGRIISPKGKETAVKVIMEAFRIRYEDLKGNSLGTDVYSPFNFEKFIKNNWNWKKSV